MKASGCEIPGVVVIEPDVHRDERGFFLESFNLRRYAELGIVDEFVQDNRSYSRAKVLRGLHYQIEHPQGQLVYVTRGEIFDVGLDLRPGSPSFGRAFSTFLGTDHQRQIYFPPGIAHGFVVLREEAEILYKCTAYYHADDEGGVLWSDPDLAIAWPIRDPIVSERDRAFSPLKDIPKHKLPRGFLQS